MDDPLTYYASPGPMTEPGEYRQLLDGLPGGILGLVEAVQGLLLHIFWAERYGLALSEDRQQEVQIRPVSAKLARILELDNRPLTEPRPLERKLVGNCRDFTVMMCAMLRHRGIPARARCGFGTYFLPEHFEDHWICEYWKADGARWVQVDAQLDAFQQEQLGIDFDPLDMPPGRFVTGGSAWQLCRNGEQDPEKFGILNMHGIWFVRDNLIRDLLALNKIEILPWDGGWGFLASEADEETEVMDQIAALTLSPDEAFVDIRSIFQSDVRFQPPEAVYG